MRTSRKVIPITRRGDQWRCPEDVMNTMRLGLYEDSAREIAEEMGVSPGCIYSIRSGRTKWPRGDTFFALLAYNGLRIKFVRD